MSSFHAKVIINGSLASVKEILEIGRKMLAEPLWSGKNQARKGHPMSNERKVILCLTAAVLVLFCVYPPCYTDPSYTYTTGIMTRVEVHVSLRTERAYHWIWASYDSIDFQRLALQCAGALLLGGVAFAVYPGKRSDPKER